MDSDIHQMIGRIDERTELMLRSMSEFKEAASDHDKRITSLESDRAKLHGIAWFVGAVGMAVGFFTQWIGKFIGIHG